MKQIVMNAGTEQTRIAIVEDRRLVELYVESKHSEQLVGNIYKARVVNVIPTMQAAFVDIGAHKNAFLYIDDAIPSHVKKEEKGQQKPNIRTLVQIGEEKLVQVNKEAQGTKAPRVTTEISLPGRMIVYLPEGGQVSISRKIQKEAERKRLLEIVQAMLGDEEGIILRTQAEGAKADELELELKYLRQVWQNALENNKTEKPPCLLYQDTELAMKIVRDTFADDVDELLIDFFPLFTRVREMAKVLQPSLLNRLKFYQGKQAIFDAYGIEVEIDKALSRQVSMKNGGFLVIDHTEAMTVIDVNTGKFTGRGAQNLEETVTQMNIEAAKEIARQLRLRDIGGIIIIDFIDMRSNKNKTKLTCELQKELSRDKTTSYVLGMTQLGLVEMTRKKIRQNLADTLTRACPTCLGKGKILSVEEVIHRLEREVIALYTLNEMEAVLVELDQEAARLLTEESTRADFENKTKVALFVKESETLHPNEFHISFVGSAVEAKQRM